MTLETTPQIKTLSNYGLKKQINPINQNAFEKKEKNILRQDSINFSIIPLHHDSKLEQKTIPIISVQYTEPEDMPQKYFKKSTQDEKSSDTKKPTRRNTKPREILSGANVGLCLIGAGGIETISKNYVIASILAGTGLLTYAISTALEKSR